VFILLTYFGAGTSSNLNKTLKIPKAPTSSNLNKTLLHVTLQLMMLISGCSVTGGGHSLRKLPTRIVNAFTYLSRQVHLQAYTYYFISV